MTHAIFSSLIALSLIACSAEKQQWHTVSMDPVLLTLEVNGELASSDTILISPPLAKMIWEYKIEHMVPEGEQVSKGDMLISFNTQTLDERLRKNTNQLIESEKDLENKQIQSEQKIEELKLTLAEFNMKLSKADRKRSLAGEFESKNDVEKMDIELALAKQEAALGQFRLDNEIKKAVVDTSINTAEVNRLRAEVDGISKEFEAMQVVAPKDGIVVYVPDHEGIKKASGDTVYIGQNIIELPNLSKMIVKTSIPEHEAVKVALGQAVNVTLDAAPDKRFSGKISQLSRVMRRKSREEPDIVFDAQVALAHSDTSFMRPGMTVRLEIIEKSIEQAIRIPLSAITYINGNAFVEVKSLIGTTQTPVAIEAYQNSNAIIVNGLKAGDQVLI
jgi:HlyD family secretion protein